MTARERPIGEDELHAYVDGFLEPERRLTVERYLADYPDAAARIAGWQAVGDALCNAAAWKFQEPVPAELNIARLAEARIASRWGPWRIAASIVVALAVGAGSGWLARGPSGATDGASGNREVAAVQPISGAHPVQLAAGQPAQVQGQLTQQSGGPATPPDLSKSGYRLVGRQLVATEQGPACKLLYDDAQGARITLLMRPAQKPDVSATQFAEAGGGNGRKAPELAEAGSDNGGRAPQFAEASGGNVGRAPQFAEANGDNAGRAPQLAEAGGGNGGGATTLAAARPCP